MSPLVRVGTTMGVSAAVVFGVVGATRGEVVRSVVISLAVCVVIVTLFRYRYRSTAEPTLDRLAGPLSLSWLGLTIGPMHSIAQRPIQEAVGSPGTDAMVEVAGFGLVAVFSFEALRILRPDLSTVRIPLLVVAYPIVALASASWSTIGGYTLAKGVQLLVLALVSVVTIEFGRRGGDVVDLLSRFLRGLIHVTFALIVIRTITGPMYLVATGSNVERYALVGMHPILTGFLVGFALVIVLVTPAHLLRVRLALRALYAPVFALVLFLAHSRASVAAVSVGLATAVWVLSRQSSVFRTERAPWFVGGAAVLLLPFWDQIFSYLLRGGGTERLVNANGRTDLWPLFLEKLETTFDWVFGLGHGQSKILLIDEIAWANSAHSSVVAVIVNLGLVGVAAFLALVVRCGLSIRRARRARPDLGAVAPALFAMLLLWTYSSDSMIEAAGGLVILYLLLSVGESVGADWTEVYATDPATTHDATRSLP